jgi:ataxin-10
MLSTSFFAMSTYAQQAIQRALGPPTESGEAHPVRRVSTRRRRKSSKTGDQEESTSVWFEESPNVSDAEELSGPTSPGKCEMTSELEQFPAELDVLLPKVCEASVLITQCIVTIVLEEEEVDYGGGENLKAGFNKAFSEDGKGLIESLVGASRGS